MPIVLDDLRWEQEATRDALYGIMSAFGITKPLSFVLSGCVVTKVGYDYSWTEGYICLAGEICKVVAGSITASVGESAYWEVQTAYDVTGTKVFEDSTSHDCYEIRNAALESHAPTAPATRMAYNAPTFAAVIARKAGPYIPGTWYEVGSGAPVPDFDGSWGNSAVTPAAYPVSYMKDLMNVVHIRGEAAWSGGSTAGVIFTLPAGCRPSQRASFIAWGHAGTADVPVSIQVFADGTIYIYTDSLTLLSLDGISFHI